jgi:hypothetical protein
LPWFDLHGCKSWQELKRVRDGLPKPPYVAVVLLACAPSRQANCDHEGARHEQRDCADRSASARAADRR